MDTDLGVVTVWYGGSESIARFIDNKRRIKKPNFVHLHIFNSLIEQSENELRAAFPDSVFVKMDRNIGTTGAWNRAIELLRTFGISYVGIWNPDIELADNCLSVLQTKLKSNDFIGAVCPLLFFSSQRGTVQFFGGSVNPETGEVRHDYRGISNLGDLPESRDAGYLDGGTMMMKMSAIQRAGMFDERLFIYQEDVDFCIRLHKCGLRTIAVRDAVAWHYHDDNGECSDTAHYAFYDTRNMFYLVRKHGGRIAAIRLLIRSIWFVPRRSISFIVHGDCRLLIPYWAGAFAGLIGMMGKRGWVR